MTIKPPDLRSSSFKANPYPIYARLRREAPAVRVARGFRNQPTWLVTRYEDVAALLKGDARFAKKPANAMTPAQLRKAPGIPGPLAPLANNLLSLDPPEHTRLRALVTKAFTPRTVEQMRSETEELANELLDRLLKQRSADLIAAYALPLPITIIGRILGVPERDNRRFHAWTQAFVSVRGSITDLLRVPSIFRLMSYLRRQIRQREKEPRDDLITALVQAREEDDRLTEDEVLAMCFLLLSAGHETTVNLIASGTLALLEHRDQWDALSADPELMPGALEELLRFVTPAEMSTERYAKQDLEFAGAQIPRGELVLGVIASANRDEDAFTDPETLDIRRERNKHLSFGQGIHYCVGSALSRLEGTIAINALVRRAPDLRLAAPATELRWRSNVILRGLKELPVAL